MPDQPDVELETKYPWMISDKQAYLEWKSEKAWDLTDEEVRETFGDIKNIVKDYKWSKFEDWFTKPRTINEENFGEATCNEIGGIWEYDPDNRARGQCVVLDVADIGFSVIEIKEEGEFYPRTEFVTDLHERRIRLSKRTPKRYIHIHVDDAVSMEANNVDIFRVRVGDKPYVYGYARKHKAVIYTCSEGWGREVERGLCVKVSPMDDDEVKVNQKINEEIRSRWARKEPFFLENITKKFNRPRW